jgi:AraC-like DNA-binding protein
VAFPADVIRPGTSGAYSSCMQQARILLAETDLTVAVLSRRVGYPDVSYFIKRFRADHGMTPAQRRQAALPTS